jgi:hypothetical protein
MRLNRNMTDGNGRIFLIQMTQLTYLRNNHFIVLAFLVKSIRRGGGLQVIKQHHSLEDFLMLRGSVTLILFLCFRFLFPCMFSN